MLSWLEEQLIRPESSMVLISSILEDFQACQRKEALICTYLDEIIR